jgi:serine/threonine protein kinase/formylglycine-generating enzyme required for sulfatase activity
MLSLMGSQDDSKKPGRTGGDPVGGSSDLSRELTAATPPPGAGARGAPASSIDSGTTLDHFEVLELLGAGGFGEVYRARDTRLGRMVAIKVLPEDFARDAELRERFRREAMAASALNHPNICTVYDLADAGGKTFIVMELVEGKTIHAALANGPLPAGEAIAVSLQIADALADAHRAGILHRDIKSANVVLTPRGQVKVLDFGLAKRLTAGPASGEAAPELTREGTTLGTLSYMSPEQLLGKAVDRRSDLFSFGVVVFEMVTGRLPFQGSTTVAVADAILHAEPRDFGEKPVPEALKAIVRKLLDKDPERRFASAEEVHTALKAVEASMAPARSAGLSPKVRALLAAAAVAVLALAGWLWHRASRTRWAREAVPEIARLVNAGEFPQAAALLREARTVLPGDAGLEKLWMDATSECSVESDPPGADISIRPYRANPELWETLGQTPLRKVRVPRDYYVWKISKSGFRPAFAISLRGLTQNFRLDPDESVPPEMVRVPGQERVVPYMPGLDQAPGVKLDDYLIDRHEVTNVEYKKFVDAGGYGNRDFWKEPFVRDGRTIPWEEGVAVFRDTTGRPGPATWEVGTFPKGLEKHPVAGVSWYEAAAYTAFAGKSLPTVYHWNLAAQPWYGILILPGSNFRSAGTRPVGEPGTLSGFGTTDMAGNVKEWCLNESGGGRRYILGGGFGEPQYMFVDQDAQSPWDRKPNFGFRCVKLTSPPPSAAAAKIEPAFRDYGKEKPVSDEVFRAYKGLYAYDKGELNARVEETATAADWTREKVSFNAAYGDERVIAYLYLPKNASPPFQTIVYFPGSNVIFQDKFEDGQSFIWDFIPKSGRALMFPIYKSTFERRDGLKGDTPEPTALWRDHTIMWSKDLGRSLDYLETRKDVDAMKLGYFGFSWGSAVAPILLAVEDRVRVAILGVGGLEFQKTLPEVDQINFVTRMKTPALLLNGRYDFFFPVESSQLPLFRLLGTSEKDKRQVIFESGHMVPAKDLIRESLDWLDKYLGPVKR